MRGELQSIGEVIESMVTRLGIKMRLRRAQVVEEWAAIVGERIAKETQAERVRGSTLFVFTSSSVWAQELEFMKQDILKKIRSELGKGVVTDIRFRTGPIGRSKKQ